eukprot:SAG22_NODE_1230_length_5074_cov_3.372864_2_plen_230_part_00
MYSLAQACGPCMQAMQQRCRVAGRHHPQAPAPESGARAERSPNNSAPPLTTRTIRPRPKDVMRCARPGVLGPSGAACQLRRRAAGLPLALRPVATAMHWHRGTTACQHHRRGLKTLHLVRHAQSNWNVATAGEHVGAHPSIVDQDSRLSPLGEQQAAALAGRAKCEIEGLELVLSSPLSRAMATAQGLVAGRREGRALAIRAEPLLTEWLENSCDGAALQEGGTQSVCP